MTKSQKAVLDVLSEYGPMPDHALVPLAQHMSDVHLSSSGIRTRRSELAGQGLVHNVGDVKMPSGRRATVWAVS